MFRFIIRIIGMLMLSIAFVLFADDLAQFTETDTFNTEPVGAYWFSSSPDSLQATQSFLVESGFNWLWDPTLQFFLSWPEWLMLAVLGLILAIAARRKEKRHNDHIQTY